METAVNYVYQDQITLVSVPAQMIPMASAIKLSLFLKKENFFVCLFYFIFVVLK